MRQPRSPSTSTSFPLSLSIPLLLLLLLFSPLPRSVAGTCRFPEFLQRDTPWAASYGQDARLVMYVKGTYMTVSHQADNGDTKYTRKCETRAPDNKFLVTHQEKGSDAVYLCIQFLQRSENIVQMKVSTTNDEGSLELCDERNMAIDRWPIVQMSQTPEQKIPCPFLGGYNVNMFYPNDTAVCQGATLLVRMESECERGEGIIFDFRMDECIPASLPRSTKQQAYCIAHWTQAGQTFIILQHSEVDKQTWCLRISDPLSDIHGAHLMLDLVCDTGDVIRDTKNYFRLTMSRRVYASTCEDEIESDVCQDMIHLCKTSIKRHCARTCGLCDGKSEMRDCAFEETYRGLWMESSQRRDRQLIVGPYSLSMEHLGRYDCLKMEGSEDHKDKMMLAHIDENGCYPRYACVEMEKISSSVMKFRLGNRHQWPLPSSNDNKDHLCAAENFLSKNGMESRYHVMRPPRLLVKESFHRVSCGLPRRLQNGVAFRMVCQRIGNPFALHHVDRALRKRIFPLSMPQSPRMIPMRRRGPEVRMSMYVIHLHREEGQNCSGCLMYQPSVSHDRFVVRPHNCSYDRQHSAASPHPRPRLLTIDYSCLAAFVFHNNTYAVVTKTNANNLFGQYLCWIFTPDNHIKVIKAAETFLFEEDELLRPKLLAAQFTIVKNDARRLCHNVITMATSPVNRQSTTSRIPVWARTPRPTPRRQPNSVTYGPEVAVTYRVPGGGEGTNPEVEGLNSPSGSVSNGGALPVSARTSTCTLCGLLFVLHVLVGCMICRDWDSSR